MFLKSTCKVKGCTDDVFIGMVCYSHQPHLDPRDSHCSVSGCHDRSQVAGFCTRHYQQMHNFGKTVNVHRPTYAGVCVIAGCTNTHKIIKGYCQVHYHTEIVKPRQAKRRVEECSN